MIEDLINVQVSLSQLLDLALGTPEVGSVNFNILHNFLHILLKQFNLVNKNVEYKGDNANQIKNVLSLLNSGSNPVLQEDKIIDCVSNNINTVDISDTPNIPLDVASSGSNHEVTVTQTVPTLAIPSTTPSAVQPSGTLTTSSSVLISPNISEQIDQINNRLAQFETNLLYVNDDLTELRNTFGAMRQSPTVVSLSSKEDKTLDETKHPVADEKLPNRLASIVESISMTSYIPDGNNKIIENQSDHLPTKESSSIGNGRRIIAGVDLIEIKTDVVQLKAEMTEAKKNIEMIQSQIGQMDNKPNKEFSAQQILTDTLINAVPSAVNDTQRSSSESVFTSVVANTPDKSDSENLPIISSPSSTEVVQVESKMHSGSKLILSNDSGNLKDVHIEKSSIKSKTSGFKPSVPLIASATNHKSQEIIDQGSDGSESVEAIRVELTEALQTMEIIFSEAVRNLEFRVAELESKMKTLNETMSNVPKGDMENIQEIQELVTKIQNIHSDIDKINETAARLNEEKEKRDSHTNVLIEQIELLKMIKADKEDLEDALADKADATAVNKKVSYDRFNTVCDDLARGVDEAISKWTRQESIWQQSLDTVQQEIDNKLDKIEISPIREYINNRLQTLQEKIKELDEKKHDNEAAGTKKILTGLQCISCDKDAVMRIEQEMNYYQLAVSPTRNIKSYLTYELDKIRKQKRKLVNKNRIQLNSTVQERGGKTKHQIPDVTIEKTPRDHLCNRYCGGSHTITTPQQRIMRTGHFLAQWGPETIPIAQGSVCGTDGQLYHSTSMPSGASNTVANNSDVCGSNTNTCCGIQNQSSSDQPVQQNKSHQASESVSISQKRSSRNKSKSGDTIN